MRADCSSADATRLIVFSPLPPLRNGIADYTAELLPLLSAGTEVVVVIDDHAPAPEARAEYRVIRLAEYASRQAEFEHTPHLYQLGNNADHVYLLPWLVHRPGVVVLHDVSLHHLVDQATLRWDDPAGYDSMLELEHGQPGRVLAQLFRRLQRRPRSMFYELPLTREFLARARAVIVHSLYAANKVAAQQPQLPVVLVRHHVDARALQARRETTKEAARQALGLADDALYLVSLGFVTKAKQIEAVLRFIAKHRQQLPLLRYVLAGQDHPDDFDVRSLIVQLGLDNVVTITGYVDEVAFYRYVVAADIVVNLRYPSGGETSGTLIRALGAGACVVVNDIGPFSEYPDDVCAKVSMRKDAHEAEFERVMLALIGSPSHRQRLGQRAAEHIRQTHSLAESARRYRKALRAHAGRPVLPLPRGTGRALLPNARLEPLLAGLPAATRAALPLWAGTGAVPLCRPGSHASALLLGHDHAAGELLQRLFGYAEPDIEIRPGPASAFALPESPRRSHDLVMVALDTATTTTSLGHWLARANARLLHDGHLLLTLHGNRRSTLLELKQAVAAALEDSGYALDLFTDHREWLSVALDAGTDDRAMAGEDPQYLWRARKVSEFISPRLGRRHAIGSPRY